METRQQISIPIASPLRAIQFDSQLQTTRLEKRLELLESVAQAMALELARFEAVFSAENEKFDPPLPLDSLQRLLAKWRVYVRTR